MNWGFSPEQDLESQQSWNDHSFHDWLSARSLTADRGDAERLPAVTAIAITVGPTIALNLATEPEETPPTGSPDRGLRRVSTPHMLLPQVHADYVSLTADLHCRLPAYAHELNPVEPVWSQLKTSRPTWPSATADYERSVRIHRHLFAPRSGDRRQ